MPAQLTSRRTRSWRSATAAAARSTASRSPTSQTIALAAELRRERLQPLRRRATSTQRQPRAARRRAIAAPIPLEPPVTTATGGLASVSGIA